jgi:hypothetical protein
MEKKVRVAKGVSVERSKEEKMRKMPGSSSVGKYKKVDTKYFAGEEGGESKYSYPINTLARARNALSRAHFALDPEGIKEAVYKQYPALKTRSEKKSPSTERRSPSKKKG